MNTLAVPSTSAMSGDTRLHHHHREGGAVSWGAVFAGAVGAAAFSLILVLLGTGLGLSAVSPWAHEGISGVTASVSTIVWITVVQILASVLGGYLAGRLRSRWVTVHTHEVYFRDTAHGFLAWSVATLMMASLLSSAVGSVVSTGVKATSAVAVAGAAAAGVAATKPEEAGSDSVSYSVDSLFRATPSAAVPALAPNKIAEVTRIFANGLKSGELEAADTQYLGQVVAQQTGLSQADAEKRVTDTFTRLKQTLQQASDKAKQIADDARKASAYLALWLVISLLIGAFAASLAATFGGRLRDSSILAQS
jgi:MFS family permease